MSNLTHLGGGVFQWVLQTTWQAAVLAGLILLAQYGLRKRLSPSWRYGLWLLLVVRLLMPVSPQSAFSIFNLARTVPTHPSAATHPAPITSASVAEPDESLPANVLAVAESSEAPAYVPMPTPAKPATKIDWLAVALCGWLAGVCFFGARLVWTNGRFRSRLGRYQPITDENATRLLNDCRTAFKITQQVRLIESEEVESPAVYGFWRKWLLLPDGVFERFSTEELRCIFLHELAHIKRGDLAVNWLVSVLQVLHWFNPVLWLAWLRMRADRELATDALALAHARESDHAPYGETILKVLEGLTGERALPGLVGIVESKAQLKERLIAIARPGKSWKWAALAVAALIASLGLTGAQTEKSSDASSRLDLTGRVESTNGQPVQATVFISTAGPKVGTSPFCPSCYADCRKKAKTDANGDFKIESLDPGLIFRILVVGEGWQPKFVSKVDPVKGPVNVHLEPQNLAATPPERTVHGRIVDAKGAPIEGAAIETLGYQTKDGEGMWGAVEGIDPLAVSDADGRFVLTSRKAFATLDIKVEARGYAGKKFRELEGGNQTHKLVMTEGATLKGRVLRNGEPLANVSVGVVSADRGQDNFTGNFDVGTDADGRFEFINLPAQVHYNIYGLMSTLKAYGYIANSTIQTGADGSATDAGDLTVGPARRISGRVVLSDGQPLPPKTRLLVSRQGAWDSMLIDLDKGGHFDAVGIPPGEKINLAAQVPGYHPSVKNASLDMLNPFRLVGRVDHDITNLVLLMDKGPRLQSHFDSLADGGPSPEYSPLQGAENAGKHSLQREISGRLTDAKTGEAIARFRVTPGRWNDSMIDLDWNPNLSVDGANGSYVIDVDKRGRAVALKFEAEGYLPAASPPLSDTRSNFDFSLARGNGPSGTVLLPDGQPAVDVKVLLTCPQPSGNAVLCLIGGGNFQYMRNEALLATTDAAGHFSLAPQFDMKAVAASGSAGFKMVPVESLQTNAQITLEPWGKIKGVLRRPSGPGANEALAVRFVGAAASHALVLAINARTDDKGAFEFDQVPPGDCEIETSVSVGEDAADVEDLQKVHVPPGQTVEITIEAPAKEKPRLIGGIGRQFGGRSDLPPVKSMLHGTVWLPNGKPAADAQVGLKLPNQNLNVGDGELVGGPMNDSVVRTEADGSFTVPMRDTAKMLYAANEAGFAKVTSESWTNGVKIVLQPWGRVEGTLRINNKPGANEKIRLRGDGQDFFITGGFSSIIMTDDQGRFVFAHVPEGDCQLCRCLPIENGWRSGYPIQFTVRSGETTNVTWGGNGRPVVGKCVVENAKDLPENATIAVRIHTQYPMPPSLAGETNRFVSQRKLAEWRKSEAGKKAMENFHSFDANVAADGSFQADDVLPGTYEFEISVETRQQSAHRIAFNSSILNLPLKQIVVPQLTNPEKCEPLDLGVLKTSYVQVPAEVPVTHSLKVGDAAPAFETKTLGNQPLRLKDYRGKYVLLDLRFMLPAMDTEAIEAVNNSFAKDDRLVIISLCQDADEDYMKKLSKQVPNHWIQGDLDFNAMSKSYGLDGAQFPMIFLIDPKGNIAATDLHGEAIQSTVALALAGK